HARRAREQLDGAQRHEPAAVVAIAAPLAVLFGDLSDTAGGLSVLDLADAVAEQRVVPGHALLRHLGAVRYAMLANEGDSRLATSQRKTLDAVYGDALRAYPLTRVRLGLGAGAHNYFRAEYEAAVQATIETEALCERRFGERAPCLAEALNLRGINRSSQERNDEVLAIYRTALGVREQIFAPGHTLITELYHNLAVTLHDMGRYDLAESYGRRALAADRTLYGDDHTEVASDLSTLAAVLRSMGDARGAIELLEEAVAINTRQLGGRHQRTAVMHYSLGQAQLEAGDHAGALANFETSGRIYRAVDPEHRSVPITQHGMAKAALGLERYALARRTLLEVLERYLDIYGEGHRNVASAYRDLADAERALGQLKSAETYLLKSLTALTQGDALEVRWRSLLSLARLDDALERPESALFFGKLSISALQDLRATQGSLDRRLRRTFARQRSDSYRTVSAWLVDASRVLEAQRVLDLLKDEEYFEFTRRS
ncbi:MAG: tetratricopeptide repeat protein, partial [Pseudomonadota bacterium]